MNKKIALAAPAVLNVPLADARRLVSAADGDAALLYIYIAANGGLLDEKEAALVLRRSESAIRDAVRQLTEMGIITGEPPSREQKLPPAPELPEVRAEDIAVRTKDSPDFKALVTETQRIYGRLLSTSELKTLFDLYDYLALPPEVIMLLINHCAEQTARRYGEGRKPSFRTLEREGFNWVNRELITYERAEQWIAEQNNRAAGVAAAAAALGIHGRELTATERRYIEGWLDMGFETEALAEAMDRTVTNTGGLKWKYMDGIIKSWDSKGLHSVEQIRDGDKKPLRLPPESSGGPTAAEFERMKKLREKVRNG